MSRVNSDEPASSRNKSELGSRVSDPKERALLELIADMRSVVVAFSGGVDSAYLAYAASSVLGQQALCVTADSPSYSEHHRKLAFEIAEDLVLHHEVIRTDEVKKPEYRANPVNRCFHCKDELYTRLTALAHERGIAYVIDGNNADDCGDYRPGRVAARQLGVRSPLEEVGLSKEEIRNLSRNAGLRVWDEPASACLASRIPYHSEVTEEKLKMVEQAEEVLRRLGLQVCRVRHHDECARLEVSQREMMGIMEPETREIILRELKRIGYRYVTVDLEGYRMGSLNEPLSLKPV